MRSLRGFAGALALAAALGSPGGARAAWNNVFQLTGCGCRQSASYSVAVPTVPAAPAPCCNACPQTAYVQRSFYQPVTTYKPVVTMEPVTSYRTSYYYEPVTSYRYSCYVDPCTGCSSQVATPVTSYRLRSQCNACTSYVQKISYAPETSYRQSFYYEAVTVQPACPPPCPTCSASVTLQAPTVPVVPVPQTQPPPMATEQTVPGAAAPPTIQERSTPPLNLGTGTDGSGQSRRFILPRQPVTPPAPAVRPDRVASTNGTRVSGVVVLSDYTPRPNATLQFVSLGGREAPQSVMTDPTGRFQVALPAGGYKIYLVDAAGRPASEYQVELRTNEPREFTVVSR
jgi:hypothetical protein